MATKGVTIPICGQAAWQHAAKRSSAPRARELGVQEVVFLRHPDGLLENNLELRRELCNLIRFSRPDIMVAIDPWRHYQLHPDHRAAGQAAMDAIYAAREWYIFPEQLVENIEPWRVKEAYLFWTENPDYWEDISCCMDARIAALARHASQVGEDTTKLAERIRERAREAGEKPGYPYAEAFKRFQF